MNPRRIGGRAHAESLGDRDRLRRFCPVRDLDLDRVLCAMHLFHDMPYPQAQETAS